MKTLILALISISALDAIAVEPQIRIEARYDGFGRAILTDAMQILKTGQRKQPLAVPIATTRSGQKCVIEIIRESRVPGQKDFIPVGVTLELLPTFKDGRIEITGKSTIRRALTPGTDQPILALNFETRETFFSGALDDGKPLVLRAGDKTTDNATITLIAKLAGAPK